MLQHGGLNAPTTSPARFSGLLLLHLCPVFSDLTGFANLSGLGSKNMNYAAIYGGDSAAVTTLGF